MKTGIFLLARTDSTRLPRKLLLEIMQRPILEYQIERLKTARQPDRFVLCTTERADDDILVEMAVRLGLITFRGNLDDVAHRMLGAAREYKVDFIVSIGGDDILSDPEHVDRIIDKFLRTQADFIHCPDLPMGCSPYGVKTEALEQLCRIKTGGTDGWERYFQETGIFQVESIPVEDEILRRPELRMTLDYPEDFDFFKAIFETLYPKKGIFSLGEVITLIDSRPDIGGLGQKRAREWYDQRASFDIGIKSH